MSAQHNKISFQIPIHPPEDVYLPNQKVRQSKSLVFMWSALTSIKPWHLLGFSSPWLPELPLWLVGGNHSRSFSPCPQPSQGHKYHSLSWLSDQPGQWRPLYGLLNRPLLLRICPYGRTEAWHLIHYTSELHSALTDLPRLIGEGWRLMSRPIRLFHGLSDQFLISLVHSLFSIF